MAFGGRKGGSCGQFSVVFSLLVDFSVNAIGYPGQGHCPVGWRDSGVEVGRERGEGYFVFRGRAGWR